ncbi:DEAD/DEAH box helicase [Gallibacterium salpingitidis]|uniref:DEAD/DEAH box helicase n=1 Tax=Gallibacterium salpingitidis TaxID=505341 RepID=A0A1A7Q0W6_9PAST|nr:type I restriction endonuclease subunit R [Gallibacterium salpingitidis]OBW93507.1 DEAD/DEAH box helicase [Gallibacterium salpingitidis]OBX07032.1 DEAD/DEAH box helicase [Gallibacterium salpingitidis]OBX07582.1 DEAD/DEAH box helicase [Gallibacterium salpingitidis]WKS99582.1 DEAD/DEAH box helicase family protein [Gallibacterium salpingitidis]
MKPEEKARVKIDQMFINAGWKVVDRKDYSPNINACAIREGLLKKNMEADYLLFLAGKAIGILEAKAEYIDVTSAKVCEQAANYVVNVPKYYQSYSIPLPLIYQSNGQLVLFKRSDGNEYESLNRIHSPKEICKMLGINDPYAGLPFLAEKGLRNCQYEAISALEESFRNNHKRALMVLATGAGKTYTACMAAYRLLAYTPVRRVLFLVDRNNLGRQAEAEFATFRLTENGEPFNTIFSVERLRSAKIPNANVIISTIQRLFSLLKGEDFEDNDEYEGYANEDCEIVIPQHPQLPPDFFDLIIIDECHRSIYGNWKSVLDYFSSANLIGLTATPQPETLAFFNKNCVVNYTLEQSIIDGINVDSRIYRIKTEISENGGTIAKGEKVREEIRYTGKEKTIFAVEDRSYTKEELNRSVVNPAQIRLVLETYRDAVYSEMFIDPPREADFDYLPKTLIFALNEQHATNIVEIAKEVFNRTDDDFVQKITYSAKDSDQLIRNFRNDKKFRIAVTCTLVATGTDIKPLEVLLFMRDVASEALYIQMKGRGVRTINDDQLRTVTPNAHSKDHFFLVDAVGVTEHEKNTKSLQNNPTNSVITLSKLLELITHGNLSDEKLHLLASRLSRIGNKSTSKQRKEFIDLSGIDMLDLARNIFNALADKTLPPYKDINESNTERKALVSKLTYNPKARELLLILNAGFVHTLLNANDQLISKGFSIEEAKNTTTAFEKYCFEHKDEIEALRIIYNNTGEPLSYLLLSDLIQQLKQANNRFNSLQLWNAYALQNSNQVKPLSNKDECEALTNIIQLVRYAFQQISQLQSIYPMAQRMFNLWYGKTQLQLSEQQKDVFRVVVNYIASNGAYSFSDLREYDQIKAAQLSQICGDIKSANEALYSLSNFLLTNSAA